MAVTSSLRLRVGIIGSGALGQLIRQGIHEGVVPGVEFSSVLSLDEGSLESLMSSSDIIIEAAGQPALEEYGPTIIAKGLPLIALSNGVLADDAMAAALTQGPGFFFPSAGAIGGFDLIDALRISGTLTNVTLQVTKKPEALVQEWMSDTERKALREMKSRQTLFSGSARLAAIRFPANANVAATLGFRSLGLDETLVTIDADPSVVRTSHVISLESALGSHQLRFANVPSRANPKSSELAAYSALHDLSTMVRLQRVRYNNERISG